MSFQFAPNYTLSVREFMWVVASYFLGCFTAGYYWTRWRTGQDIRRFGSGNVGARNVGRALGAGAFTVTFLLDLAKGALAVAAAIWLGLRPEPMVICMVAVVFGHNWPMQLRFHGGKGVAVSLGALLAYDPFIVLCLVAIFLVMLAVLRSFTLSGMTAFALGPLAVFLCGLDKVEVAGMSLLAIVVLVAHRKNIREEISRIAGHRPVKETPIRIRKGPTDEV